MDLILKFKIERFREKGGTRGLNVLMSQMAFLTKNVLTLFKTVVALISVS